MKSDAKLKECQHAHCDSETEKQYFKSNQFRFSCFIGIEGYYFLDARKFSQNKHHRVLIKSGNILFFRNDVDHHGTDNNSNFTH